jgi:hypothetical protein
MPRHACRHAWPILPAAALLAMGTAARAQEMEPRAYSPSPVGLHFASMGVSQSSGGMAVDPSLPLENVDATFNGATIGYLRTFSVLGRAAGLGLGVPYAWGTVTGDVFEERREARRSGIADSRLRFNMNIVGGPAQSPKEFAARKRATSLGASLTVAIPTGEYESGQLVNIGSNRWAVKPEIGLYQPFGNWSLELAAGVWFFADNDDFYTGGVHREQDPMTSLQAHLGYTFRRNLWIAGNYTYYAGGRTTLDGERSADLQKSTRAGLTMSLPISAQYSVKLAWSDGVTTRIGSDFTTYSVTLQRAW